MTVNTTPSRNIYTDKSRVARDGRGVFANTNIKKGVVIERCPFIEIPKENIHLLVNSVFVNYIFFFGPQKQKGALALGFGSLYCHSNNPNAKFQIKSRRKIIEFVAIKNINEGEEITFNYRGRGNKDTPLWFEQ